MQSGQRKELGVHCLLKAYAKLCGAYRELIECILSEATADFSGGIVEELELSNTPTNLGNIF